MKQQYINLIEACRAYLNGESYSPFNIDYEELFEASSKHNLTSITYCAIKDNKNVSLDRFENAFFESVYRYEKQSAVYENLTSLLSENNIKHVIFKGTVLRELFPVPQSRIMGDIDVLIEETQRDKVKDLLVSNGYICKNMNGPVYDYVLDDVLIEMHTSLINGTTSQKEHDIFIDAVNNAIYDGYKGKLDNNYHFAYLLAHLAHHFRFYGAGIKLVLDLAVMLKECDIDLDKVFKITDNCDLTDFTKVILTICYKWFGFGKEFVTDTSKCEEFIVSFGAFGLSDRNTAAVNQRREYEEGYKKSGFISKIRLLFPSYKKLKEIPYIKFIEGRPYLTPIAWIYRFYYNLRYRKSLMLNTASAIGSKETQKEANEEYNLFKEIGLI